MSPASGAGFGDPASERVARSGGAKPPGNMIDRYVVEVSRHLPEKTARAIEMELRSSLRDAIEAHEAAAGRPADEAMVAEMLVGFGHPEAIAASYRQPRSLIGPAWYPSFRYVAVTILTVVTVFKFGGLLVRAIVSPEGVSRGDVVTALSDYVEAAFVGVAMAAFVIAGLERVFGGDGDEEFGRWDPLDLPPADLDDRDAVDDADLEKRIIGNVIMIVLLLFFPRWLGVPWGHQYQYTIVPLADLGIHLPLVLLTAFWSSALALRVVLLRRKHWTRALRRLEIAIGLTAAAALVAMLLTAGPARLDEAWFAARGWTVDSVELLGSGAKLRRLVLAVIWALLGWQVWQTRRRLLALRSGGRRV